MEPDYRMKPSRDPAIRRPRERAYYRKKAASEPGEKRKARREREAFSSFCLRLGLYGLTLDQYHAILERQDFCCAICGEPEGNSLYTKWHVDHCHATGRVRGVL